MKTFILPLVLFAVLSFSSCNNNVTETSDNIESGLVFEKEYYLPVDTPDETYNFLRLICREWRNSWEEETDSVRIFRPVTSKEFPASRFRETLEFYRDGSLKYLFLHPSDGHYFKYGRWGISKRNRGVIGLEYTPQRISRIKIIELNRYILTFINLN